MEIRRADLDTAPQPGGAVVVIDVLRSFTTAAYAFGAGARRVFPVEGADEALALRARLPRPLTMGAVPGGAPIAGFDFGNSPSQLAGRDLQGRDLVHCTAGGVRALARWSDSTLLVAGSFVCAAATVRLLRRAAPERLTLVVTGVWTDRDGDEDHAFADYLEASLLDERVDPAPYLARVRASDFGRRFTGDEGAALPRADLECCAQADRFDFALVAVQRDGRMQLQTVF